MIICVTSSNSNPSQSASHPSTWPNVDKTQLHVIFWSSSSIKSKTFPTGIGDDCAVIDSRERLITSKDISVSGVHFPKELEPYFIAYRSVAIAISDIFAMGGRQQHIYWE